MTILGALIPISVALGAFGLAAFVWCIRSGQFDDLEGDQHRALFDDD
ncbi:MAG: cbb3-type cytochrome oxidase assembly protein CcoS [Paracoccaceae bacterium]